MGSSWNVSAGPLDTRRLTRRRKDIKFREAVLAEVLGGLSLNKARETMPVIRIPFRTDREPSLQHVSRLKYGGEAEQRHQKAVIMKKKEPIPFITAHRRPLITAMIETRTVTAVQRLPWAVAFCAPEHLI